MAADAAGTCAIGGATADPTCPYRRPFARDFLGCPAYLPVLYLPLTSLSTPLEPVWTCEHIELQGNFRSGYRPGCRLGPEDERRGWAQRHEHLIEVARLLRVDLVAATADESAAVFAAKATQLRERQEGSDDAAARALTDAGSAYVEAATTFVWSRAAILERAGLPPQACVDLIERVTWLWLSGRSLGVPDPPDEVLAAFPEAVRPFLRPPRHGSRP